MTTLPTTFDDNNTSLIYTSKRQKLNFCGNALGDDSTLKPSLTWQQCKFRGNASNSAALLAHASNSQTFILCGNALDEDSTLIHSSSWQQCNFCGNALGDDSTLKPSSPWQQCKFRGNASNNVAPLMYASKRQKPTAQGDTLGKHPYVGLRPVRAKALHIKALRMLLSLQDVHTPFNITRGVTPGCTLLPLRGVNLQCTPTRGNILCCALFPTWVHQINDRTTNLNQHRITYVTIAL